MADNNNNPEYSDLMNDNPSKEEEILEEKPYYDVSSPKQTHILNNNINQSEIDNNNLPSQDNLNIQQGNESIPSEDFYDTQENNNNQFSHNILEQPTKRKTIKKEQNPNKLIILSIIIIIIVIADSILEIIFDILSPYIIGDDIAIFTIAIAYLVLICKKIPTNHCALVIVTGLVCFIGFGIKGFGLTRINKKFKFIFIIPFFFLIIGRTFVMIYYIQSCKCN